MATSKRLLVRRMETSMSYSGKGWTSVETLGGHVFVVQGTS